MCFRILLQKGKRSQMGGEGYDSYASQWQVWRLYTAPCLTKLDSQDWGLLSLACISTMIRGSSFSLQNIDSSWSLSSPSGSMWAAASPKSVVSTHAHMGHREVEKLIIEPRSKHLCNHWAMKSNHPGHSPKRLLFCYTALLTKLTVHLKTPVSPIISQAIMHSRSVCLYALCIVVGSCLTTI